MGFQNSDCDHHLDSSRRAIVVLEKEGRVSYVIVDVACPFDTGVAEKEREKEGRPLSGLKKGKCKRSGTPEVYLFSIVPKDVNQQVGSTWVIAAKILRRTFDT